jgi:D-amino peptidase
MDSTEDAVIAHTYSSAAYQCVKVNGEPMGELAIDAAVAGALGVPPLFCASDDKGTAEARRFFPGVETVTTKTAYGWNAAVSKHPRRAVKEIYDGARRAVERRGEMKPFTFPSPLDYEVRFKRIEAAESAARPPGSGTRVDAYTVRWTLADIRDRY